MLTLPDSLRDVSVELEMVTPDQAQEWLQANFNNRRLSEHALTRLEKEIEATGWRLVPDAVAFDIEGNLVNGQHRLTLIASGADSVPMIVVRGLTDGVWDSTDTGKGRTFADTLQRRGEKNTTKLAAATALLYEYEQTRSMAGGDSSGPKMVHAKGILTDFLLRARPDLRGSIKTNKAMSLTPAAYSVIHYCIAKGHGVDEADGFFETLLSPARLDENDPVFVLHKRLQQDLEAQAGSRSWNSRAVILTQREVRAFTIIAFNKWIRGEPLGRFTWKAGGRNKQPFPLVDSYPYFRGV